MDLRRDFLFPVIIWIVIQRDFILGGQAGFNNGPLILNSTDTLQINTTAPSIEIRNCGSCNFSASYETRNSSCVANVIFSGDIELKKGSSINVTGKCALSMTSQNGNIIIKSDINMTCDEKVFNTTCLGGFTQSSQPKPVGKISSQKDLYKAIQIVKCQGANLSLIIRLM
ncbi:uncharacterized protein LOC114965160 [Acropora millepora]|uniref:uncharacterized protein LOC114965160 n=1 Tax=Acropora millepora TaxID=45264 RepID=UPI001CF48740|nr:uncharacterized protein LOC114965160 [Acropora millepora]